MSNERRDEPRPVIDGWRLLRAGVCGAALALFGVGLAALVAHADEEILAVVLGVGGLCGVISAIRQRLEQVRARRLERKTGTQRRTELERGIVALAARNEGRVRPADVCLAFEDVPMAEARQVLDALCRDGHCGLDSDDRGALFYDFQLALPAGREGAWQAALQGLTGRGRKVEVSGGWQRPVRAVVTGWAVLFAGIGLMTLIERPQDDMIVTVVGLAVAAMAGSLVVQTARALVTAAAARPPASAQRQRVERAILLAAARNDGRVTAADVALASPDLSLGDVQAALAELARAGTCGVDSDARGALYYDFNLAPTAPRQADEPSRLSHEEAELLARTHR